MKYEAAEEKTEEQILQILSASDSSGEDRVKAVLSALFYGETIEFSADVLIKEFSEASYHEKRFLKNLFATLYGMYRVDYRIDESIALLKGYAVEEPSYAGETQSIIDELNEYKDMLANTDEV